MDLTVVVITLIPLLLITFVLGFKAGSGRRRAEYESNITARVEAQHALSQSREIIDEVAIKMNWILLELPASIQDQEEEIINQYVKAIELSFIPMVELLDRSKQLQMRGKRTSPFDYERSTSSLIEKAEEFSVSASNLKEAMTRIERKNTQLQPMSLRSDIASIKDRHLEPFRSFIDKVRLESNPIRRTPMFKEFVANVSTAESTAATLFEAIDNPDKDRYVIRRAIGALRASCTTLEEVHVHFDPDAELFYLMPSFFKKYDGNYHNYIEPPN